MCVLVNERLFGPWVGALPFVEEMVALFQFHRSFSAVALGGKWSWS
jgi:hypothetical protein